MEGSLNPLKNIRKPSGSAERDRRLRPGEFETLLEQLRASGKPAPVCSAPAGLSLLGASLQQGDDLVGYDLLDVHEIPLCSCISEGFNSLPSRSCSLRSARGAAGVGKAHAGGAGVGGGVNFPRNRKTSLLPVKSPPPNAPAHLLRGLAGVIGQAVRLEPAGHAAAQAVTQSAGATGAAGVMEWRGPGPNVEFR